MWILPKPISSCAQAGPDSDSALTSFCEMLAASVWWRGKPSAARYWCQRWKRVAWLRHLYGRTFAHSTGDLGVVAFVASLPASPVSPIRLLDCVEASLTSGTCGRTPSGLLGRFSRRGYFSKTSQELLSFSGESSNLTWRQWATGLRRDCSRRRRLARRIGGRGCSSWPTVNSGDAESGQTKPNVARCGGAEHESLRVATAQWTTPQAHDTNKRGAGNRQNAKAGNADLNWDVAMWQTPNGANVSSRKQVGATEREPLLDLQARQWSTPQGEDSESCGNHPGASDSLTGATGAWPTPKGRDWKGQSQRGADGPMDALANTAENFHSGPPDPQTSTLGVKSSQQTRRLNPRFVEWLMGWCQGWTALECSATELFRYRRRWRSLLCGTE